MAHVNTRASSSSKATKRRLSVNSDNPVICELCKTKIVESVDILKSGFESLNPFTEKLLSLQNLFTNLVNKAESVQNSIEANLDHMNTLNDTLVNFKHGKEEPLQTVLSQNGKDYDFSLNLEGKHVVHPVKPLDCCPTRGIEEYSPNFLAVDSRNAIGSFLTSLNNKFQSAKNSTIIFGESIANNRMDKSNTQPLSEPLLQYIEQICTKYPDTTRPNSVTVTKCVGPVTGSSLQHATDHYTKPQSLIFKINIGDSCDINFTNTSSGATVTQRVDDNSLLTISQQSRDFLRRNYPKPPALKTQSIF